VYTTIAPKPALSGAAMAQANASRVTPQPYTSGGMDAQTPSATVAGYDLPSPAHEGFSTFSLPHQPASANSPTTIAERTPASPASPSGFPGSLRSTPGRSQGAQAQSQAQSSTVTDETMNLIDEHITDMSRLVVPGGFERRISNDSASQYSSEMGRRPSFIDIPEDTDEEVDGRLTRDQVMKWSPEKVAEYLENAGVEKGHCEVFMEEEFSGEVLLGLDQSTILLQELKLGSIGRRMRTWQKIRALQDEVKNAAMPPPQQPQQSTQPSVQSTVASPTQTQFRPNFTTPNFSRAGAPGPATKGSSMDFVDQINQRLPSPTHAGAQTVGQGPRPSAASVRSMALSAHSRRQSSIDQVSTVSNHAKQASFDRGWTMNNRQGSQDPRQAPYSGNARPMSTAHLHSMSSDRNQFDKRQSEMVPEPAFDPEAGYTSASELDVRRQRNIPGVQHEKKLSETVPGSRTGGSRIVSEPVNGAMSPMITKLGEPSDVPRSQRMSDIKEDAANERKGFRATSDAVTGREKALAQSEPSTQSPTLAGSSTGTPSIVSKADFEDANKSDLATPLPQAGAPSANRRKSKKATSAYIRGLEKKTPQEQMVGCDYSGWMKKKSSNLMTTWKPRFFVLKGRRLSYYYSMNDTEEKGLIDISNHRVLPADGDFLTGLHATLSGATRGPTSPPMSSVPAASPASATTNFSADASTGPISPKRASTVPNTPIMHKGDNQTFIFKLLPPRTGLSKAVNFTKPTVHYFAVPSLADGRHWMASLMKATIDRDESAAVVSTYTSKTISLEKARARRERPPELRDVSEVDEDAAMAGGDEDFNDDESALDVNGNGNDLPHDGARRIELTDPGMANGSILDDRESQRTSSVVSSSNGYDGRSASGSNSGSGSGSGVTGARTSMSARNSSSLRESVVVREGQGYGEGNGQAFGQGLGIQGYIPSEGAVVHGPAPPPQT